MRIGVIGIGHVGLVTAAALADLGHEVVAMDLDAGKVELLQGGKSPFHEPGLDELLTTAIGSGRLSFTRDPHDAVHDAGVVFICVGRPATQAGDPSLTAVEAVGREIAQHASAGVVIAEKSTVPPGTADRLRLTIARERPGLEFSVVANPEFLREGRAVRDTLAPDRIVVGSDDSRGFEAMREVFGSIVARGTPLLETDVRTAELSKLASNAFLATKISFANALARIAEATRADVVRVTEVMGADPRIGEAFLSAGLGYGGYCLPKDAETLVRISERAGYDFALLREATRVNEEAVAAVAAKVEEAVWNLEGKRIALLGVAFKADTDDVRSAPALALARRFVAEGATVVAHDPMAAAEAKAAVPELETVDDPYEAVSGAHCVVVCTEWSAYRELDLGRIRDALAYPILVDGRNWLDPTQAEEAGLTYLPVGRLPRGPETERGS
ncbi:MAG: UDP-glucose dehydrogenase family protein [Actinomycetota bacterium]